MTSSVNEQLLKIKSDQRAVIERKYKADVGDLDRDIAMLKRVIEMEAELASSKKLQDSLSIAGKSHREKMQDRSETIVALLSKSNGEEVSHTVIADSLGMNAFTVKDWMHSQMKVQGEKCPWTVGSNGSRFKLKPIYETMTFPSEASA